MPKKLEQWIGQIVVQAGADDGCSSIPSELIAAAAKIAPLLTSIELSQIPDLWYPTLSAKTAGAPKLKDGWGRLWFEAIVEVAYQVGPDGLPVLLELFERDTKTYHALVMVRLLRLAAANVQKKAILDKVKSRLPELACPSGSECVEETMLWAARGDQRLSKLKIKGLGEETVGSVMKEWADSQAVHL